MYPPQIMCSNVTLPRVSTLSVYLGAPGRPSTSSTGAIAGGVAAGAALIFAVPAIGFAWYRRRRPQEHFFDVPGKSN